MNRVMKMVAVIMALGLVVACDEPDTTEPDDINKPTKWEDVHHEY